MPTRRRPSPSAAEPAPATGAIPAASPSGVAAADPRTLVGAWTPAGLRRDAGPPRIALAGRGLKGADVHTVVVGLVDDAGTARVAVPDALPARSATAVAEAARRIGFRAGARTVDRIPAPEGLPGDVTVLVGLGKPVATAGGPASGTGSGPEPGTDREVGNDGGVWPDAATARAAVLRRAAAAATRNAAGLRGVSRIALVLPASDAVEVRAVAEGAHLGAYSFDWYRTAPAGRAGEGADGPPAGLTEVLVDTTAARAAAGRRRGGDDALAGALEQAQVVADAVWLARDLVNLAPIDLTPAAMAAAATEVAAAVGLTVTVLDDDALRDGGYGGILAVGAGSVHPPRLVVVEHAPPGATAHVALVGKGITFDSGGLSLKPPASMPAMKGDMAGAAAVLAAVTAAARVALPVRVTGYLAMAENMPSGTAQRPSDVIRARGGRSIEVLNTDAEGRLVLADALVDAVAAAADAVVDIATLTGAALVALGSATSALLGTDVALRDRLVAAAGAAGEPTWPLPFVEELRSGLDSAVADIANVTAKRDGGTIVGALFLREFVRDFGSAQGVPPWAHLDVAGPAFNDGGAEDLTPKGGTGVPVRTLVRLLESYA